MPIENTIVVISGFGQRHGRPTTGIDRIWFALHQAHAGPKTNVVLKSYDDDMTELANVIFAFRSNDVSHYIAVVGYSWGFGEGAIRLAKELNEYGMRINHAFAIDAVYQSRWYSGLFRSMLSRSRWMAPSIRLPPNIDAVMEFRQNESIPQGHRLVPTDQKTKVTPWAGKEGLVEYVDHQSIDNSSIVYNETIMQIEDDLEERECHDE